MEEHQQTNGNGEAALYEDVLDEDEARLIIDEGRLFSEDKNEKYKFERKNRFSRSKSRKDMQEMANTYPCPDCGKTFRRKAKLEAHFLTHKSKDELECENCKRKFRKVDTLFSHVCSGLGNRYKCSECDEWFRLKRDLIVHQQSHKQGSSDEPPDERNPTEELDFSSFVASFVKWPVTCTECGAELTNLQHYNAHMAAHKKGGPSYFCWVCKTKFSYKDDYLLHKDLCHIEGIFECTFCCKRFRSERRLSDHLESHSGKGEACDICGMKFLNKEKLSSHMRVHSSTNLFVCAKCKKIFRCNSSLQNHNCAPENSKKKLYTFDGGTEKMINEQCQDSLSTTEDSDSEDAELCEILIESHACKVCGDSFQQKEDLISHLTIHFQCVECKKYFKSQTDLDMHKFLLADEKLFSCCLCEAVVHGKKELEGHISSHLAAEEDLLDDLEWEDNAEVLENISPSSDANETLHTTSLERSFPTVKIHKVTPAGRNGLKCLRCGKFVFSYHNLSAHIEASLPTGDSDEEYVYISRLGSPQVKLKQKEDTYCSCHHSSANVLGPFSEQSTNLSVSGECGDQEFLKVLTNTQLPTHLHTLKHKVNESFDNKTKSFLSQISETSFVALDANNKQGGNIDKSEETSKFEKEGCKVTVNSVNSTELLEKSLSSSIASSITATTAKKDCNNISENSKASLGNVDVDVKKEVNSPKKLEIRVIKLDSSKVDSPSSRSNTKELYVSSNPGKDSHLPAPVRIFVTTSGLLSVSANNEGKELGSVSELPANQKTPKSSPVNNKTNFRKILPKVNIVALEDLVLPPPERRGSGQVSEGSAFSPPKKIKVEAPMKRFKPSKCTDFTKVDLVSFKSAANAVKTSDCEKVTFENESLNVNIDKCTNGGQQSPDNAITAPVLGKPKRKSRTPDIAEPAVSARDKSIRSFNRRTHFKKREHQGKSKIKRDTSHANVSGNDSCHLPEANMIFKVEKLSYDSEEDDEDDSLDFSGIKKEFLASDVFIKEEWDIVDF